jgi:hypothetical protein
MAAQDVRTGRRCGKGTVIAGSLGRAVMCLYLCAKSADIASDHLGVFWWNWHR